MQEDYIWKPKVKKEEKKINWLDLVGNFFIFIAVVVVIFFTFSVFSSKISYSLFVIKTGSMEPTIKTGSLVLSKKMTDYQENDIITFSDFERGNITHRIVKKISENGTDKFETKGDFNEKSDRNLVEKSNVLGKMIFSVPFLGYLMVWVKSWWGLAILILIPAIWIIFSEISKIKKELKNNKENSF